MATVHVGNSVRTICWREDGNTVQIGCLDGNVYNWILPHQSADPSHTPLDIGGGGGSPSNSNQSAKAFAIGEEVRIVDHSDINSGSNSSKNAQKRLRRLFCLSDAITCMKWENGADPIAIAASTTDGMVFAFFSSSNN